MATPLFYVDLSEDARDYRHTALEPGLPLLDRQGVNYQILRKWLGDYVAEPEWRNENVVAFYMSEEERGRLEDVDCQPVTRGELEKKFADDLEGIRIKIKKIKPESSTEQMVHRILKKNIAEQTNDLESSDFDSYFHKCRTTNEDWRLIWCCGFQRSDLEPLKAKLWRTPDGDFLGVRPPLQGGRVKKRKRRGPLAVLASPWLAIALILLLALFLYAYRPKLVVSPNDWAGPMGSRIEFKVEDHRWFFFEDDVTSRALAQSNDPRIVEFDRGGVANAIDVGQTSVSFLVDNKMVYVPVRVDEPTPPDSLTIEPGANVKVAIGSTKNLKAIGHYEDGNTVDLTTQVSWWEEDDKDLLVFNKSENGMIEGDTVGATKVFAQYPVPRKNDTYAETSIGVQVVQAEFTSLRVALQAETFAVGQTSRVEVFGIDKKGDEHSLSGSSLLSCKVAPTTAADVDGPYLVGNSEGSGELQVSYADLAKTAAFTVAGRMLAEDVFRLSPSVVDNAIVHELIPVNVTTGTDEPITAASANNDVVDVFLTEGENAGYEVWLAARGLGQAEITVSQGSKSAVVNVTVVEGSIESMQFNPPVYTLRVGQSETAGLEGTTDSRRLIKVVPDALVWERQPRVENVQVDKNTLRMDPLEATDVVQDMQVRLVSTDLLADATVTVSGGLTDISMLDEGFGVHPPVAGRRYLDAGSYLGDNAMYYDADAGGVVFADSDPFAVTGAIPDGSLFVEHNGVSLVGLSDAELLDHFRRNPVLNGDVIRYQDGDLLGVSILGEEGVGVLRDFKVMDVAATNLTPESFNAQLRLYLRLAGDYRLTDATGNPLSEWSPHPSDATPLVVTPALARNTEDDYELYYERQIAGQVRKFQIPFNLGRLARRMVETVDVDPVIIDRGPDVIVDPRPDPVIVDDNDGGRRVIRKTTRIRRSGDGASVIRSGGDTVVVSGSDGGTRVVSPSGTGATRMVTAPGSSVAGSPGSGSRAPGAPSPGSPSPGTPSPNSQSPASPSPPSPSPGSPSPSPASPSPSPSSPSPAPPSPASPASPSPKPAPAPASPSPASPKPSPAPASPSPKPQGSDTRAPASPAKPAPASPALAKPTPSGSDTRAPSAFRPRTPAGSEAQPASAYANPAGSATRADGIPAAGRVTGAAAGAAKTMPPTYTGREPPKVKAKDGEKTPLLQALEQFRQDRKKRENITGKGRIPVIKSSKDDD